MTSESQRRATAAFVTKRKALGWRKVTLWLSPEALFKLDAMKASAGSKDKAAEAAILAYGGNVPETPKPPSVTRITRPEDIYRAKTQRTMKVALIEAHSQTFENPDGGRITIIGSGPTKPKAPAVRVDVPVYAPKAFNPRPKIGKK